MGQLFKVRDPSGNVYSPGDWTGAEPLWTTIEIGEGSQQILRGFSYGVGGAAVPGSIGPRKANDADTNLQGEGGRLPENEELIIFNIAVDVFAIGPGGGAVADSIPQSDPPEVSALNMMRLQRDVIVELRVASVNKVYIQAPVSYFPAAQGVRQYNSGARTNLSGGTDGYVSASNGSHNAHEMRELASPQRIQGGESFSLDFTCGPGEIVGLNVDSTDGNTPGRLRLRSFLDGYRRRPVA